MLLHLDDLETTSCGGRIWLTIGDQAFPEERWYDLPGVLLDYWVQALRSFGNGHTDFCKLGFMDGPYAVWLTRKQNAVHAACMERGKTVLENQIDFPAFWDSVRKGVRTYERKRYFETKQ